MPTNVTHAIPAIAIGLGLSRYYIGGKAIVIGAVIASLPDLDMLGTRFFGIPWDSIYGHRGYTPVSYTHLDVYKRQILPAVPPNSRRISGT